MIQFRRVSLSKTKRDNSDFVVPALFYRSTLEGRYDIIVDPNYISTKDLITLRGYRVSEDSKYIAYQYSTNGSDWTEIRVVRLGYDDHLDDHLVGVKHSNIEWKDDGFYYSAYPKKDQFDKTLGVLLIVSATVVFEGHNGFIEQAVGRRLTPYRAD